MPAASSYLLDMFATLDGATEIAKKKPRTKKKVASVKSPTKESVDRIQEDHQQDTIEMQGTHQQPIKVIQYENVGLQCEIQAKTQETD